MEIPESLPTATMLNQNTDTYNDYLGELGSVINHGINHGELGCLNESIDRELNIELM